MILTILADECIETMTVNLFLMFSIKFVSWRRVTLSIVETFAILFDSIFWNWRADERLVLDILLNDVSSDYLQQENK